MPMRRLLRWIRNAMIALAAGIVIGLAVVYLLSERVVRRTYSESMAAIAVPTDAASIAEGERLSWIRGCHGCHGADLSGKYFEDDLLIGRIVAPSLTRAARKYSDPELARIIRRGVRPDGRSVLAMPSEMFAPLTDEDLGRILAYLRTVPEGPGLAPEVSLGPMARLGLVTGQYAPAAVWVRVADSLGAAGAFPTGDAPLANGAYLARTACTECHGLDLNGDFGPNLQVAAGYSREAFAHFFETGEAAGGRKLELMSQVVRSRFRHFTDDEESALYAYLQARAGGRAPS